MFRKQGQVPSTPSGAVRLPHHRLSLKWVWFHEFLRSTSGTSKPNILEIQHRFGRRYQVIDAVSTRFPTAQRTKPVHMKYESENFALKTVPVDKQLTAEGHTVVRCSNQSTNTLHPNTLRLFSLLLLSYSTRCSRGSVINPLQPSGYCMYHQLNIH
jgi:hypothetical protein